MLWQQGMHEIEEVSGSGGMHDIEKVSGSGSRAFEKVSGSGSRACMNLRKSQALAAGHA